MLGIQTLDFKTLEELRASLEKGFYEQRILNLAVVFAELGSDTVWWWDCQNKEAFRIDTLTLPEIDLEDRKEAFELYQKALGDSGQLFGTALTTLAVALRKTEATARDEDRD